jgi:putative two-component system response regulator
LTRLKHLTDELDSAESAFMALALTIEARDPTTNGHAERLSQHAVHLGRALSLADDDLHALRRGGYLHDIGKIGIPDSILLKPGSLTACEFELMKRHTLIGDHLCAPLQSLRRVRPIVLSHHERLDGSGYPHGLKGDEVPLLAQIVSIIDVYDAITSNRPYRVATSPESAIAHLRMQVAKGRFARHLIEAFLDVRVEALSAATN